VISCSAYFSTLKMGAICSSKTSVDFQRTTRRYIPLPPLWEPQIITINCDLRCSVAHLRPQIQLPCWRLAFWLILLSLSSNMLRQYLKLGQGTFLFFNLFVKINLVFDAVYWGLLTASLNKQNLETFCPSSGNNVKQEARALFPNFVQSWSE
jgi:hypothetical protein